MRKILPLILGLVIITLILEGLYYLYYLQRPVSPPILPNQEASQITASLKINNFHPKVKLVANVSREEIERLISTYGKSKVEIRVVAGEEDLPLRPQGGGRGVGTYFQDKGNLVLAYRIWSEYQNEKDIFYFYPNPEVFLSWQTEGRRPEKMVSRWFLDFLANNHYGYLLPNGTRMEPKEEDVTKYVEVEKPLFDLEIKL